LRPLGIGVDSLRPRTASATSTARRERRQRRTSSPAPWSTPSSTPS